MISEVDLKSLWHELDDYTAVLDKESKDLKEIWVKIAEIKSETDKETQQIDNSPEFQFIDPELIIGINVGGQLFELPVQILVKDPFSLLAGICRINPVIKPDAYGIFYFDRDWWLFRHIISFLRSNALPRELETLKQLYAEASYYRINLLRKAIENISIHDITNFSPQIAVTWPGVMDGGENPLRREQQSYVLDGKLFSSLRK